MGNRCKLNQSPLDAEIPHPGARGTDSGMSAVFSKLLDFVREELMEQGLILRKGSEEITQRQVSGGQQRVD